MKQVYHIHYILGTISIFIVALGIFLQLVEMFGNMFIGVLNIRNAFLFLIDLEAF